MFLTCAVCSSDENDGDTLRVDWDWGTVRYRMSNYNPAPPAAAAAASAAVVRSSSSAGARQPAPRSSAHVAASSSSSSTHAAARTADPVNGVAPVNKHHGKPASSSSSSSHTVCLSSFSFCSSPDERLLYRARQ